LAAASDALAYVTKDYLVEVPEWVLQCRSIRRTFTSRGFWPTRSAPQRSSQSGRVRSSKRRDARTSGEIIAACQQTLSLMWTTNRVNRRTGEVEQPLYFVAEIRVTEALKAAMRSQCIAPYTLNIEADSPEEATQKLEQQLGCPIEVIRWTRWGTDKEVA
jgi:hypothetical protein